MSEHDLSRVSDEVLASELARLAQAERNATASLVAHLAEFDARRLYLGAGFPSLFAYSREVLRLSEHAAYTRIEAARASRVFPVLLPLLDAGQLNLTTVRLLAPHLTRDNCDGLLEEARFASKREVEELIARRFPRPDVATSIRREPLIAAVPHSITGRHSHSSNVGSLPAEEAFPPSPIERLVPLSDESRAGPNLRTTNEGARPESVWPEGSREGAEDSPARVTPLAPGRYLFRFTASAETHAKLRRAQELMRHSLPSGDVGTIVGQALDLLLAKLLADKVALTRGRVRTGAESSAGRPGSRHVPGSVRRSVWLRDEGRCAFVAASGRRCAARGLLEFHHVRPFGIGGVAVASNIELRCCPHNAHEARLFYAAPRELVPGTS